MPAFFRRKEVTIDSRAEAAVPSLAAELEFAPVCGPLCRARAAALLGTSEGAAGGATFFCQNAHAGL